MARYIDADNVLKEIEALKQSPWFNRGKGKVDDGYYDHSKYLERKEAVEIVADLCIKGEPTADVEEVRRGKWILEREPDGKPYCYHCSNCDDDFHHIGIEVASKRCPECGAYMDQEHIYERDGSVCGAKMDGGKE